MVYRSFIYTLLATSFVGCATQQKKENNGTTVGYYIDAIVDQSAAPKKRYTIVPGNPGTAASDLYFKEFSSYLQRALNKLGYIHVQPNQNPDLAVLMQYWIGDAESTTVTSSVASGVSIGAASDSVKSHALNSSTTSYTLTTHAKTLKVIAADWGSYKNGRPAPVWETKIQSRGYNTDLRQEMPWIISGGLNYFGQDTRKQVFVNYRVEDRDPKLRYIAGQIQPAKLLEGDIVFESQLCKSSFSKSLVCGSTIKGVESRDNKIKFSLAIQNTSSLNWKKPRLHSHCYYKTTEIDDNRTQSKTTLIPLGDEYNELQVELKTTEKKQVNLDINLDRLKLPKDRKVLCDLKIVEAQEVMF